MGATIFKRGRLSDNLRGTGDPAIVAGFVTASAAAVVYLLHLANQEAKKFKKEHPELASDPK